MEPNILPGDLVFLTQDYENYVYERNPKMKLSLVNRLAKLESIIDWNSTDGKIIKDARIKSGKWENLPLEDNKFIFSIYYHDVIGRGGKQGVIERGIPLFSKDPKLGLPFFIKIPDWVYKEILKKCETFTVQSK